MSDSTKAEIIVRLGEALIHNPILITHSCVLKQMDV